MKKILRYLLFPLSILWTFIIWIRNKLYDKNIFRSASFNIPLICIGNLSTGGTGKTPMTEYLVEMLQHEYTTATLSRGYRRKTKGFFIAGEHSNASDIGDEPMQLHKKFPDVTIAVCEDRTIGIPQLLFAKPDINLVILDDAFQHRRVKAGLSLLLSDYNNLYTKDFMLPFGTLRDVKSSSNRAQIIIITKCKESLTTKEKDNVIKELELLPAQKIFFSATKYKTPYHIFSKKERMLQPNDSILLVCGIANSKPLEENIIDHTKDFQIISYKDHHNFTTNNLAEIKATFEKINSPQKIIIITEKDSVKLVQYKNELQNLPVYILPIQHIFLFNEEQKFSEQIFSFIKNYERM